ncbi:hypothetical protein CEXT_241381 [Caerostris extrusa]|uniref:Uncharacterized protein n=1 Tax=Caerostris extrusa TaxID=172846 RepID=A0AAV4WSY2_CAEEX|nr:hypothetical protein CEXT_241381 [Caerostris extrusa]
MNAVKAMSRIDTSNVWTYTSAPILAISLMNAINAVNGRMPKHADGDASAILAAMNSLLRNRLEFTCIGRINSYSWSAFGKRNYFVPSSPKLTNVFYTSVLFFYFIENAYIVPFFAVASFTDNISFFGEILF